MLTGVVTTSWPQDEGDPAGHFVRAHVRELERDGHEVVVIAPAAGRAFGWPGVAARLRQQPLRAIDAALWIARARRRLQRLGAERIVAHWCVPCAWPIAVPAAAAARSSGAAGRPGSGPRLDVVSHGGDVRLLAAAPPRAARAVVRAVAERAASWTFPSDATRLDLLSALDDRTRAAVERIAEVRAPPIDMPDVAGAVAARRRELGTQRVAVCVGRLVASKRVDRVIGYLATERAADVLVVVGDGPERARLERMARGRRVDVRFVGRMDRRDALAWIGAADVLIHASEAEGLSTVLREAAALGTPVVRLGA